MGSARGIGHLVNTPDPSHICRADLCKNVADVAPHGDIITRIIAIHNYASCPPRSLCPGIPPTIHFPIKSQKERMSPVFGIGGELTNKCVICPACNHSVTESGLVGHRQCVVTTGPAKEGNRAVCSYILEILRREGKRLGVAKPRLSEINDRDLLACIRLKELNGSHIRWGFGKPILRPTYKGAPIDRNDRLGRRRRSYKRRTANQTADPR